MSQTIELKYKPQPKQISFHTSTAQEVLYGGAAGGGKSEALLNDAIAYALRHPGANVGIFRRTYPELNATLVKRFLEAVPDTVAHYNKQEHTAVFYPFGPGAAQIMFCYCQNEEDVYRYQSVEFDYLGFDELTHFTEFQYLYLTSRLRSSRGYPTLIRAGTNPGNVGHGWVKNRFIEDKTPETIWTDPETGITRSFIPARVVDNPSLMEADPQYVNRLQGLPEIERRALLDGDWDIFAGQFFNEWRYEKHVIEPFQIPNNWRRWFGFDFGYANPSAGYFLAKDYDDHVYAYSELYGAKMPEDEQADKLLQLRGPDQLLGFCDPAIWAKVRQGQTDLHASIADKFIKKGLSIQPANNDRLSGWSKVRYYLQMMEPCAYHRALGWNECPRLHVFSNCTNLIRTLPQMIHDDNHPEDLDTEGEDHAVDALRYGLMGTPNRTEGPFAVTFSGGDPLTKYGSSHLSTGREQKFSTGYKPKQGNSRTFSN